MAAGDVLITAGETAKGLFLIESGSFVVTISKAHHELEVGALGPGDVAGEISLLAGGLPAATVTADSPATVRVVLGEDARSWIAANDGDADALAEEARRRVDHNELTLLFAELVEGAEADAIEAAIEEVDLLDLGAGDHLFHEGDDADAGFVVVRGRLAESIIVDGRVEELTRMGRGQIIGERALFEGGTRATKVQALRASTVARISSEAFQHLLARHPKAMLGVARALVERLAAPVGHERHATSTIAVAVTTDTNVRVLTSRFIDALSPYGEVGHLTPARVDTDLGSPGISGTPTGSVGSHRLDGYLHEYELTRDLMLLEVGPNDPDEWAERAFGVADRILLVVSPEPDSAELATIRRLASHAPGPTKVIAVVHHGRDADRPRGSLALVEAIGADDVLHMRSGSVADAGRVARLAASRGVALVLGGGGARGFAHLGVYRALLEAGVPVDLVAGASIGSALAAAMAVGWRDAELETNIGDLFRDVLDYTVPVVALTKAERISKAINQATGDRDFEDLWIPFLCVSTNLTHARTEVHRTGPLAHAVRASLAIPGVIPPVPSGDDLLVDGGVLNNLPVDVVAADGRCDTIISVDVAPPVGPRARADYGLSVSGWDALKATVGRGKSGYPGISAILMRSLIVGSRHDHDRRLEQADVDLRLELRLRGVGMLEFNNCAPVVEQGYEASKPLIEDWLETTGGWG